MRIWGWIGKCHFFQYWQFTAFSFPWSLLLSRCRYGWRCRGSEGLHDGNQWPFQFSILQCWMTIMCFDAASCSCAESATVHCSCAWSPLLHLSVIHLPDTSWAPAMYISFIKVESTQNCRSRNIQSVGQTNVKTDHYVLWHRLGHKEACPQGYRSSG